MVLAYNILMHLADFLASLSEYPLAEVRYFDCVSSTNDIALEWAQAGADDGSLVLADEQTSGRGRLNRTWITPPGSALAFSLIIKPAEPLLDLLQLFSPLGALAVCEGLEKKYQLTPQIKWPNDVLLMGKKTAGVLAEAVWVGNRLSAVVLGIGVNVAPESIPPSEQLRFPATCVEIAAGKKVDRFELFHAILGSAFAWYKRTGRPEFIREWERRLAYMGSIVSVTDPGHPPRHGKMVSVGSDGNLCLQDQDGVFTVLAGDVSLRPVVPRPEDTY